MIAATPAERYRGMVNSLTPHAEIDEYLTDGYGSNQWCLLFFNGRVQVVLEADDFDPYMNLYSILTLPQFRKKGYANQVMNWICEAADKWGVRIELDVNPFEHIDVMKEAGMVEVNLSPELIEKFGIMDSQKLENYYRKFGFKMKDMDGIEYFLRYPSTH